MVLNNLQSFISRSNFTDPKKFVVEFDAYVPLLNIKADYKLVGNVIQISTEMKGRVHMDLGM